MTIGLRKSGISAVGDIPWGTHFCYFYESVDDLLEMLVPYFMLGLDNNELCVWASSIPELPKAEATAALIRAHPDFERHLREYSLVTWTDEWPQEGEFNLPRVVHRVRETLTGALSKGYAGMRIGACSARSSQKQDERTAESQVGLDKLFANEHLIVSCAYPLANMKADELLDTVRTYQFAAAKRYGKWNVGLSIPVQSKTEYDALRSSEAKYRALAENSLQGISIFQNKKMIYANPVACTIYGYSAEELVSMSVEQLIDLTHPDDRAISRERARRRAAGEYISPSIEVKILHKSGATRHIQAFNTMIEYEGQPAILSTQLDITERKQAEAALHESEERCRLALDVAAVGAWWHNFITGVVYLDTRSQILWGFDHSEVQSIEMNRRIHADDEPRVMKQFTVARDSGNENFSSEFRIIRPDGQIRWLAFRARLYFNGENRNVVKSVGTYHDITDRRRAEQALRHTQAELARVARSNIAGQLTASIAHEVNQPLAAVVINANACLRWLASEPPNFNEAHAALDRIVRDGNRASEVVGRIRSLLKNGKPVKTYVNVREMIGEIVALTEIEVHRLNVSLKTQIASEIPPVLADRVQLQQVLLNLVVNSLDSLSEVAERPRQIYIRAEIKCPGNLHIEVEDNGIGVDPLLVEQVFDAFYSTKPHGLGMGLSISKSIVEAHNGRMCVMPGINLGVTFLFSIPLDDRDRI